MKSLTTITEALQEMKTIDARVEKKYAFIKQFLYRPNNLRDPHEKDGGSAALIAQERQAAADLLERKVQIRSAINQANIENKVTIGNQTRSIAEWIIWKRYVAPVLQNNLDLLSRSLESMRRDTSRQGLTVTQSPSSEVTTDIIVNINENDLAKQIESLEEILSTLDGQLSLKNATISIEV